MRKEMEDEESGNEFECNFLHLPPSSLRCRGKDTWLDQDREKEVKKREKE